MKGENFSFAWLGLYIVSKVTPKRVATLKKQYGEILKVKYSLSQSKLYVRKCNKPPTAVITATSTPLNCNEINYWDSLPNEFVERILLFTIKESGLQTCETLRKMP